jgi:hypothetical protein
MSEPAPVEPWSYGRYRVVIQRRVTEEEQISVECYEPSLDLATATFDVLMDRMNAHRVHYNEQVVMVSRGKLAQLDRLIEARAEEVRDLDDACAERRAWLLSAGIDPADMPAPREPRLHADVNDNPNGDDR